MMSWLKRLFNRQKAVPAASPSPPPPPPEPEPLVINEMTPEGLAALLKADEMIAVVDLRQVWEYSSGHIPGAMSIPLMQLPHRLDDIPREGKVIMQCYHGLTSLDAAGYLIENGWETGQIFSLAGGISGWVIDQGLESLAREG